MYQFIIKKLSESIQIKQSIMENSILLENIEKLTNQIIECFNKDGKLVICGNGGSASDALHFAGEIIGKFQKESKPWPVVVLNADIATMTAIANDLGYHNIFARQAEAHLTSKDMFIGISTSGNSENVYRAVLSALQIGSKTAAFLGNDGGRIGSLVDYPIIIPCNITARIQESHITIIHIICEIIENELSDKN